MDKKKFKFVDPTKEEQEAFMNDFNELAKKHSLAVEAIPQFKRIGESKEFSINAVLLIQKSIEEVEVVAEGAVLSDSAEVNPTLK